MSAAAYLARVGYQVTIYEQEEKLGGILSYGIPEFRLDRKVIEDTINKILELGIIAKTGQKLGKDFSIEELRKVYDAVFIGIGANKSSRMGIQGEENELVLGANELLQTSNHPNYLEKTVAVIGGGNVAMDSARTIKRLGAKRVYIIYRRAEEQMPAEPKEIQDAKTEGIEFLFQTNILKIMNETKIECIRTKLVQTEKEERPCPVNIENSNFELDVNYVIMAVGSKSDRELLEKNMLELDEKGHVKINGNYETNIEGVFAGGDLVGEEATVAWASRSGREAAKSIERWLTEQ